MHPAKSKLDESMQQGIKVSKFRGGINHSNTLLFYDYIFQRVGCDMKIGSSKNRDVCGVCGGDGSTCNAKYAWTLESTSACSESCGGGMFCILCIDSHLPVFH